MICRACLRGSSAVTADAMPAQRLLLRALQRQSLSLASPRPTTPLLRQPLSLLRFSLPARLQQFSTSAAVSSAPAETEAVAPAATSELKKPGFLSEGESQVWDILLAEFAPTQLVVQDISGGCGSMYGIEISSEKFRGLNMLKQQRLVNAALGDLVKQWHGVQLKTRAP